MAGLWARGSLRTPRFLPDSQAARSAGYRRVRRYFARNELQCRLAEDALAEAEEAERKAAKRLAELEVVWRRRRENVLEEIKACQVQRNTLHRNWHEVRKARHVHSGAAGPHWLRFVDGNWFLALSACMVGGNMATLIMELRDGNANFWLLDQVFLVWYIVELWLTIWYFGLQILAGLSTFGCLTWLDVILVTLGVVDQWMLPAVAPNLEENATAAETWLPFLRVLRMARLTRVLKLVRVLLAADLSWTSKPWFQSVMVLAIVANSIVLGLETDISWSGFLAIDQVFLCLFVFELSVRLRNEGLAFFYSHDAGWNILDFIIVVGGMLDQWALPLISFILVLITGHIEEGDTTIARVFQVLRMVRLVRILRLLRLVKGFRPLYTLAGVIMEAMQGMQWVVVLTSLLLYGFALLATRLIGHGLLFSGEVSSTVSNIFPTVPESMFVLFEVMNGRQRELDPMFLEHPGSKAVFVAFMVVSNWAILAILTAVVSDNMLCATERTEELECLQEKASGAERQHERLVQIFSELDSDGSLIISKGDFMALLDDENLCAELSEVCGLQRGDLEDLFNVLEEERGVKAKGVHYLRFIEKLMAEEKPLSQESVFSLELQFRNFEKRISNELKHVVAEIDGTMARPTGLGRPGARSGSHLNLDGEEEPEEDPNHLRQSWTRDLRMAGIEPVDTPATPAPGDCASPRLSSPWTSDTTNGSPRLLAAASTSTSSLRRKSRDALHKVMPHSKASVRGLFGNLLPRKGRRSGESLGSSDDSQQQQQQQQGIEAGQEHFEGIEEPPAAEEARDDRVPGPGLERQSSAGPRLERHGSEGPGLERQGSAGQGFTSLQSGLHDSPSLRRARIRGAGAASSDPPCPVLGRGDSISSLSGSGRRTDNSARLTPRRSSSDLSGGTRITPHSTEGSGQSKTSRCVTRDDSSPETSSPVTSGPSSWKSRAGTRELSSRAGTRELWTPRSDPREGSSPRFGTREQAARVDSKDAATPRSGAKEMITSAQEPEDSKSTPTPFRCP